MSLRQVERCLLRMRSERGAVYHDGHTARWWRVRPSLQRTDSAELGASVGVMSLSTPVPSRGSASPASVRGIAGIGPQRPGPVRRLLRRAFESGSEEPNLDHVRRVGARFLGLGFIGYPIVSPAAIAMSSEITAGWWVPLSIVMSVVPGLMLVVASFRSGTRWLGPLAIGTWCAYLGTVGLWFLAWDGSTLSDSAGTAQWMIAFCGMPSMVLMLVHPGLAALSLLTSSGLAHVSQQMGRFGHLTADLPFEVLWSFVFTSVFLAVVLVAIRTGRTLDETQEDTYRSAANAAAATAREAEKARFDAIVHDRVIASLLAVRAGRPDERLAEQARSALDELECVPDRYDAAPVSASEALWRIRSAAAGISERIDVQVVRSSPQGKPATMSNIPSTLSQRSSRR